MARAFRILPDYKRLPSPPFFPFLSFLNKGTILWSNEDSDVASSYGDRRGYFPDSEQFEIDALGK